MAEFDRASIWCRRVPYPHSPITAAGDHPAIGQCRHRHHPAVVMAEFDRAHIRNRWVPQPDPPITAAGDHPAIR